MMKENKIMKVLSFINRLIILTTLFIKSLLTSLCQREDSNPSLEKRGKGRFLDVCKFNFETLNISIRYTLFILLFSCIMHASASAEQMGNKIPRYVGSDACKSCHENEYKNFITYAKKATSFRSIERVRKGLTEEEIKGCYTCHTTGYGKPGGFISAEKTPYLKNAGCEVCHGPGEFHVSTGSPQHIKRKMKIEDCEVCHTSERVRAFRYKPMIHGGAH